LEETKEEQDLMVSEDLLQRFTETPAEDSLTKHYGGTATEDAVIDVQAAVQGTGMLDEATVIDDDLGMQESDAEEAEALAMFNADLEETEAEKSKKAKATKNVARNKKLALNKVMQKTWVWLPLTFPPVPKKVRSDSPVC